MPGAVDPAARVLVLAVAVRVHQQPGLHRPTGQIELPDTRLGQGRLGDIGGHPHDQVLAMHPTGMLPSSRNARPPNICFSMSPGCSPSRSRTLGARP
jgi:hypothetical protein